VPRYAAAIRRFLKFTVFAVLTAFGSYALSYIGGQPAAVERRRWRDTLRVLTGLAGEIGGAALPVLNVATQIMALIRS